VTYPETNKHTSYQPNEIATFVLNPFPTTPRLKVNFHYSDMEKEEVCDYDSVSFYSSVIASFALAKR
jgi:hypothetical protein